MDEGTTVLSSLEEVNSDWVLSPAQKSRVAAVVAAHRAMPNGDVDSLIGLADWILTGELDDGDGG